MNSFNKSKRDEWIENYLPTGLSVQEQVALKVSLTMAYNAGFEAGTESNRASVAEQEREDKYGPMFY